jgi:hypothetical protein
MSEAYITKKKYLFFQKLELANEGQMVGINFLLLLLVEILDLIEDVFQRNGNRPLMDGQLSYSLLDFVGCGLHNWGL